MLISSITNNLTFKSSDLRAKRYQVLKQNGLSQFQQASTNKKPGPDNLGNSDISIFERIRNCATYYHNAFLYRRNAYNWDQQINTGNELRKNASTVLCDYKNYESEVRCDIKNQAEKIRRNAKNARRRYEKNV